MANSPKWRQSLVRQFGYSWQRRLPNPSGPESEAFRQGLREAGGLMSCPPVGQASDQPRDRQVPWPHNPTSLLARADQVIE
jgi:hypothetical protein